MYRPRAFRRRTPSHLAPVHVASPCSNEHRKALENLFFRISQAASLPVAAETILQLAADKQGTTEDMRRAIQMDPALAANVLRRINSSYFGLGDRIRDLETAISLLGFSEIRNLCLTIFVSRMFDQPGSYRGYCREALWRHCTGVAIAARKIARVTAVVPPDEAYVAGLLHHMGTIQLDQHLRHHFCQVLEQVTEFTPTYLIEREVYSFDQAQLGEHIAAKWHFPAQVCDAIRYYQYPEQYGGLHRDHVNVVAVANFLCSRAGWTSLGVHNVIPPADDAYSSLGLNRVTLSIIWNELQSTLPEAVAV